MLLLAVCVLGNSASAAAADLPAGQAPLVLGVHPYLPHDEIITRFTPLADYLSRHIGRPVEVRVGRTYNEHISAIGGNAIDIAYMGPAPYVEMVKKYGKKPLLARQVIDGNPYLKGEIVVRRDSPLRTLADLRGKCFLFGDVNSTMSYILPQRMLEGAGVPLSRLGSYRSLEGHKNVALAVLAGSCDAGAVKSEVFREYEPKGLRALAELPLVVDHVFVANTRLPASLVAKLRTLFIKLNELPEGNAIMTGIHPQMTALVPAKDSDYNKLRMLMKSESTTGPH
jgi:phosphonate transport system substrate-binding protein